MPGQQGNPAVSEDETRERWRDAVRKHEDAQAPDDDPIPPGEIWDALHGKVPSADALNTLVAHFASAQGHEELAVWRALEDQLGIAAAAAPESDNVVSRPWFWAAVALAAAILVALVAWPPPPAEPQPGIEYREPDAPTLSATVAAGASLPRKAFALSWDPPGQQCTYLVRVSTAAPKLITEVRELGEPSFTVPPADLAGVPSGADVLWQVEFACAGGLRGRSRTFINPVR